ncbi:hypothetical protein CYLTODRAFT_416116 [Cylindrobasidium torrendii FP15055 ss-10]|uniref:RNI-like protein n=1 Tax=Cylindrobasidium torrendii FP15055 ss-10 TaxID=1314674 RepID=A0A0D7BUU3_9AGAR|nr:hypothetical protein CYLTODRAFT_416116 [Cylindrobasidium torrendii FP15055 ss-10]
MQLSRCPDALLDRLASAALTEDVGLLSTFLTGLGRKMHSATVRVLYAKLTIEDDDELLCSADATETQVGAVLSNPEKYGSHVKQLVVRDTVCLDAARPASAGNMRHLLALLPKLESLSWHSAFLPPDGLCEMLSTSNPRLASFEYRPSSPHTRQKWDAPSLPMLEALPITTLRLSALSQVGARALVRLLDNPGEACGLDQLTLDFVWLDDALCRALAEKMGRLRRLTLSTSGTKLTDEGLEAILSQCDSLEHLCLDEVQGRLSKNLWTKVAETLPPALKTLVIKFAETGAGHSWTMDHLSSLVDLPLDTLEELSIVRTHSSGTGTHALPHKELPSYIKDMLETQRPSSLKVLRLDLWLSTLADVKIIAESCPSLQLLQILLNAQLPNLFSLAGAFAGLKQLSTLRVAVSPAHAPLPLDASSTSLPTPSASPTIASRIVSTSANESDSPDILCGHDFTDASVPPLREVKKFVRKCPRLQILEWFGRGGRGHWEAHRPAKAKTSLNVAVEFHPTSLFGGDNSTSSGGSDSEDLFETEREGQAWTGQRAEELEALYQKECLDRQRRFSKAAGHRRASSGTPLDTTTTVSTPISPVSPVHRSPIATPWTEELHEANESESKAIPQTHSAPETPCRRQANGNQRGKRRAMPTNRQEDKVNAVPPPRKTRRRRSGNNEGNQEDRVNSPRKRATVGV